MKQKVRRIIAGLIIIMLLLPAAIFAKDKLIFAATLIRHGDRTPYYALKKDVHDWKLGLGQLTPIGMHEEHQTGANLRKLIIDKYKLLPLVYDNNLMYVRSGDCDRVLMSAESFLSGFYPLGTGPVLGNKKPALPERFQPIPIHTVPITKDNIINPNSVNPDKFNELVNKYSYTMPSWIEMNKKYQAQFARWSKIFGQKITSLAPIIMIGDNLNVRRIHKVPYPKGITEKEAKTLAWLSLWGETQQYLPVEVGVFQAKHLLKQIADDMGSAIHGKENYKYILYSGHDSTIIGVMSAIKEPLNAATYPPYASNINFMLFRDNDKYTVRIVYNDHKNNLPDSGQTSFTLEQFIEMTKQM